MFWETTSFNFPSHLLFNLTRRPRRKTDNNLCNLMYMDKSQNTRIATAKLDERSVSQIKKLIREGKSNTEIGNVYGVNHRTISNIRNEHTWTHVA